MPSPTFTSLASLAYEDRHQRARRALVQQTDAAQFVIYELAPGGSIPAHHHSTSWDLSLVLAGAIIVTCQDSEAADGRLCLTGAISIIPPGMVHAITNPSTSETAVFALLQSPAANFDFIRAVPPH
jgi:quercetin dioxygenase-like cupin family protein